MTATPAETEPNGEFDRLVLEYIQDEAAARPVEATLLGLTDWDGDLTPWSEPAVRAREAREAAWLERFRLVDGSRIGESRQIDRELLLARLGASVANADFQAWRRSPEHYLENGVFYLFVHGVRAEADAVEAACSRLSQLPDNLAAARANLDPELAHPAMLRRELVGITGQASFLRDDLAALVQDQRLRRELVAAAEPAIDAYMELAGFIEQLAGRASGSFVFGEHRYDTVLRVAERLPYDTRSLRELGWSEFTSLEEQMAEVAGRIRPGAGPAVVLGQLQRVHATDLDGMLVEYRGLTERARVFVRDRGLMTLPADERCVVEPAPVFDRVVAVASYFPQAIFVPGTPGTFNVPYTPGGASDAEIEDRLQSNASYENAATTVHEAYPGHHGHFVRMASAGALRQFLTSTYFVEGWAHYTEKMMFEQGFYESDAEIMGYLAARLMRAARIIVDTGLHTGEMDLNEAHAFMRDRAGLPDSVAEAEALRYAAWPTQASAYLTGAVAIEEMARRWTGERRGTLGQFHDAVTATGALPPGLAARAIGLDVAPPAVV